MGLLERGMHHCGRSSFFTYCCGLMEGGKGGVAKDSCNGLGGQVNEEASDKVLEVEQKYNEIRRPVYNKRNDIIHNIPDFWLTAVCVSGLNDHHHNLLYTKALYPRTF